MELLEISHISNDFSGIAIAKDNKKYFVNGVLEQELIELLNYKSYKKYNLVTNYNLIQKSDKRCEPECKYFGGCGGCDLQYMCDDYYYSKKVEILSNILTKVCGNIPIINLFKVGKSKRRRLNLKYSNGYFGFFEKNSNNLVKVEKCINVCDEINEFLPKLDKLCNISNLKSLDIAKVKNGLLLNFIFSQGTDDKTLEEFKKLLDVEDRLIQISYQKNETAKVKILSTKAKPILELGNFDVEVPAKFFMQATDASQNFIINIILDELKCYKNVLDLYSGIGTYSFPLSDFCHVCSFENDLDMVKNMNHNIQRLSIKNIRTKVRDLVKKPLKVYEISDFDAAIINPPRFGAKNQCKILSESKLRKIVYVSCNPDTLASDMIYLLKNYELKKLFLVDQFYWSKHMECVCVFEGKEK